MKYLFLLFAGIFTFIFGLPVHFDMKGVDPTAWVLLLVATLILTLATYPETDSHKIKG